MSTSPQRSSISIQSLSEEELRRLVLKLRWVGLDDEAAEIAERLRDGRSHRVVIDPIDTD